MEICSYKGQVEGLHEFASRVGGAGDVVVVFRSELSRTSWYGKFMAMFRRSSKPLTRLQTIMSWGLSGPRNRAWVDQSDIAPRNQLWSPCTQIAPLVVEWQVEIGSFGTKQRINTGALGRYEDAGQLSLEIVTEWKQCDGSGGQLPPVMPSPSTSPVTAEPGRGFEPAITPAGTPYIP